MGTWVLINANWYKVEIEPYKNSKPLVIHLPGYGQLQTSLAKLGLTTLGVEFFEMPDQMDGLYPPFWRLFHQGWLGNEAESLWSNLSNAGFANDDFAFMDLCSRIRYAIFTCSWRLYDISNAYQKELIALSVTKKFVPLQRFETLNSAFIYMSIHSFLTDICVLRDFLAEYLAQYVFLSKGNPVPRTRTMSSLVKYLRKQPTTTHPLAEEILTITEAQLSTDLQQSGAWLARLSAYRDIAIHYTSIINSKHRGMLVKRYITNGGGQQFPAILFPLPPDPFSIKKIRSKTSMYQTIEGWIEATIKDKDAVLEYPDALEYCYDVVGKMVDLCIRAGGFSETQPKPLVLTEKDLRGPIQIIRQ